MPSNCSRRPRVNCLLLILTLTLFAGCSTVKPRASEDRSPWRTLLYSPARTNSSPDEVALPVTRAWRKKISPFELFKIYPREQLSSPAVSADALYIGSTNKRLYSFDYRTGKLRWKFGAGYFIESAPTVAGERVCFGSSDGVMRCLDEATGHELWSFQAKSEILSSPIIGSGRLYFYSMDDRIYALQAGTGKKIWSYSQRAFKTIYPRSQGSPAASADYNRIYQLFSDGTLVCLDAEDGRPLWQKKVLDIPPSSGRVRRTPALYGDHVYVIGDGFKLIKLDGLTGTVVKTYDKIEARDFIVRPEMDALVIAGTDEVMAVDRDRGVVLWRSEVAPGEISSLFSTKKTLFVLSNYTKKRLGLKFLSKRYGFMRAVNLADGEVIWKKRFSTTLTAAAAASGGDFAFLTDRGRLEVWGSE